MSKRPKIEKPRIAVTMGDPCGVGPEIIVKAFASIDPNEVGPALIVGDPLPLLRSIDQLGADLTVRTVDDPAAAYHLSDPRTLFVLQTNELREEDIRYGRPTAATCAAVVSYIETATRLAMTGKIDGVCTCPINKANLHRQGFAFPGHTEFLQQLTGAESVVMMLAGPRLRVSLATIHHPIAEVSGLLSREGLFTTIRITAESLRRDFDLRTARVAVAALNPHAGEEGRFGREEIDLIGPVVERFQESPYVVTGPHPPDTVFHRAFHGEFDAVVAMYHDQGLIPIKLVHFHDAVNVSLGLPIIRTSVDHGTAYDLAGTGKAGSGSLEAAIRLATAMALNRNRNLPTPPVDFGPQ